jgi:hypothetical protein
MLKLTSSSPIRCEKHHADTNHCIENVKGWKRLLQMNFVDLVQKRICSNCIWSLHANKIQSYSQLHITNRTSTLLSWKITKCRTNNYWVMPITQQKCTSTEPSDKLSVCLNVEFSNIQLYNTKSYKNITFTLSMWLY